MADSTIATQCCIAGGGPAGMMLGFLLARAGVDVVVLEKHADFFRDFRGDTVHPSTLELMSELGLIDAFLELPHQKIETLTGQVGAERVTMADFRHLPTRCKFVALMPQWDFLDFLAAQAGRYPTFELRMNTEATDLVEERRRSQDIPLRGLRHHHAAKADRTRVHAFRSRRPPRRSSATTRAALRRTLSCRRNFRCWRRR